MQNFTPVAGTIGGLLIGAAAALFVLLHGRVAGIAGILGGLVEDRSGEAGWRLAFVLGIVVGPLLVLAAGEFGPPIAIDASWPVLVAGGLLVGFGTRLGSGCTSGHGVCGIARLSPRSLLATFLFMEAGMATVFVVRHWIGG